MIDLKAIYGKRYKFILDESYEHETYPGKSADIAWYHELVGSNGKLYNHSDSHLQLWINKPRLAWKLHENLPQAWKTHQLGDLEATFILPNCDIALAFKYLKPRKRRQGNPKPDMSGLKKWAKKPIVGKLPASISTEPPAERNKPPLATIPDPDMGLQP